MNNEKIIRTENLSKSFGNVEAVKNVDLDVRKGEVMALVGDNGAGKSTLIKMLCGVLQPTAGSVYIRGEQAKFSGYTDAQSRGIETVYQDLALAENQTVAANVFLGKEPIQKGFLGRILRVVDEDRMMNESKEALERVNISVDPKAKTVNLSGGQRQAVAIARTLQSSPEILILDEPMSALSIEGAQNVLDVIRNLREQGLSILFISHNIQEILTIADRVSVLSQGELMGVSDAAKTNREEIVAMMMGVEDVTQISDASDTMTSESTG
jgi:simple sugar transport system ATP-binding protein